MRRLDPACVLIDNLSYVLGIPRSKLPMPITEPIPARLVGVSVGELAQVLRFTGLMLSNGHDGVVEIRRVDSQTEEEMTR